jgi:predicted nucleic acid-binding protein
MNKTLLDTDILSEILKARDPNVAAVAARYLAEHQRLTLSVVSVFEIIRGYRRVKREAKVESFERALSSCEVLGFDDRAARLAGKIYADLELRGRPVGMPDVMIAAVALQHDLVLASGNVQHFEAIRSAGYALELINWRVARNF